MNLASSRKEASQRSTPLMCRIRASYSGPLMIGSPTQ